MSMQHALRIVRSGGYSSVGHTAELTNAALRCRLNNFSESVYFDARGGAVWVAAADVPADQSDDVARQIFMLKSALIDCTSGMHAAELRSIPIIFCLSKQLGNEAIVSAYRSAFHTRHHIVQEGAASLGHALELAAKWLTQFPYVMLASVDSQVIAGHVQTLLHDGLALTEANGDGLIPGEAACALLLEKTPKSETEAGLDCVAFSVTADSAIRGGSEPNLGRGLSKAIDLAKKALPANERIAIRISDQAGDEWHSTQASLGVGRSLIGDADLWCPADSVGYCGAVAGLLALSWAHSAVKKGYVSNRYFLCHQSSKSGQHTAILLKC